MWYFHALGPRNVYKDMLNNMVGLIDLVVMNHQNQTRTNGVWDHVRYSHRYKQWQAFEYLTKERMSSDTKYENKHLKYSITTSTEMVAVQ
jgi:hypothetical protein